MNAIVDPDDDGNVRHWKDAAAVGIATAMVQAGGLDQIVVPFLDRALASGEYEWNGDVPYVQEL